MYRVNFSKPCRVHFIGIGGISMSGLAEILIKEGFSVSGSDMKESSITDKLAGIGARIYIGQVAENITDDIDFMVYTAAIHDDNPEFEAARETGKPMLTRAQMLGQIMENYKYSIAVAGTHGKTTTTAMMTHVLLAAAKDPTVSIGGMLDVIGGNIRIGSSDYFVTEACEYTNSYLEFEPMISIILNVDDDHLDFFKNMDNIVTSFANFANKTKDGGLLILNSESPYFDKIRYAVRDRDIRVVTFGKHNRCNYRADSIVLDDDGCPTYELYENGAPMGSISLSVTGEHNVINSLSVIAACRFLGIDMDSIREGLRSCHSAKRRFEHKGVMDGNRLIVDDYAHHPTEIAASVKVGRNVAEKAGGELWIAFQPHTYSRTKAHLDEFAEVLSEADHVLLADIYAAREADDGTISSRDIEARMKEIGKAEAVYLGDFESIKKYFEENSSNNDLLITMGAGNIDSVADLLLTK